MSDIRTLVMRLKSEQYIRDMKQSATVTNGQARAAAGLEKRMKNLHVQNTKVKKSTGLMAGAMSKAGVMFAAAFGVKKLANFTTEAIKAAANADEVASKYATVFSSMTGNADKAAEAFARSFDLAGSTSQKLLADTGDLLVGFGFTEKQALDLSTTVNTLAGDLASFTNIEGGTARASQALTKMLVGETEQAKALGIVVRQGTNEYKDRVKQIMESESVSILQAKALANLEIAVSQSAKAQGDYNRTQQSTSNLMKANSESFKGAKESFGGFLKLLLPVDSTIKILTISMDALNDSFSELDRLAGGGNIRELSFINPARLVLPSFDAAEAGDDARRKSKRIFDDRMARYEAERAARAKLAAEHKATEDARLRRLTALQRMLVTMQNAENKRLARIKEQNRARKLAAQNELDRTAPVRDLREELKLQQMLNKGLDKSVFIRRQIRSITAGGKFSAKEIAEISSLAGKLFDASQRVKKEDKEREIVTERRGPRLSGAALRGSAEAANALLGVDSVIEKEIARSTKKTADNTTAMKRSLTRMANNQPAPADL